LITRFQLQDQFSGKAQRVQGSLKATAGAFSTAGQAAKSVGHAYNRTAIAITAAVAAISAAAVAVNKIVGGASQAAANFESMKMALVAVEGSADNAAKAIERMKQIARMPGLGFEESVKAYTMLRNSGVQSGFAEELIKQFGNANARAGGGKEQFDRVMMAVSQIANKPFLQGEEVLQLMEAGIPAAKILKDAFGTSDTEELKKMGVTATAVLASITMVLKEQERVAGGTRNAFDNLGDAFNFATISAGEAINVALRPMAEALGSVVEIASEGGVFQSLGESVAELFNMGTDGPTGIEGVFVNIVAGIKTAIDMLAQFIKGMKILGEMVSPILGPLWKFSMIGQAFEGAGYNDTFDANKANILADMELGRRRMAKAGQKPEGGLDMGGLAQMAGERAMAKDKKAEKDAEKEADALEKAFDESDQTSFLREIASNTKEMLQLDQRILGGGTIGSQAMSPVNVAKVLKGTPTGGGAIERQVFALVDAIKREMYGANELAFGRLGNSPTRF